MSKLSKIKILFMTIVLVIIMGTVVFKITTEFDFANDLNKEKLFEEAKDYIVNLNQNKREDVLNAHTFIDIKNLGISGNSKKTRVYVYALLREYYIEDDKLVEALEIKAPYRLTFEKGKITSYETVNSIYIADYYSIFPNDMVYELQRQGENFEIDNIESKVEEYYKDYFSSHETNELIGKWQVKRAMIKDKEVPLTEVFGSSISETGGSLNLYKQGTYTNFVGAYANDVIPNYQGHYEVTKEGINLSSQDAKKITKVTYNEKTKELSMKIDKDIIVYYSR